MADYGITDAVSSTGTAANASKVGNYSPAATNTASTVAVRDSSGDLVTRLLRQEYATTGGTCAYILGQNAVGSGADNYARPIPLATLKTALGVTDITSPGSAPSFACRAWANFDEGTTVVINASGNIASVVRNSTGNYTVNFATAMPHANYVVTASINATAYNDWVFQPRSQTTTSFICDTKHGSSYGDVNLQIAVFC
ncbi:hypothetical protein SAMN04490355_106014 [Pelosinus propionicus DSM 13327]|uniref:Uncharacterized protein n=1 Tax=Pelosinus propionicus DSM 13327 TaxID=1123291 RepID=A0A1I4PA42_9FIRM|nr:hypothetical protein SAMN04490355_106014 [Pelosinus propionicus DSM 13327]